MSASPHSWRQYLGVFRYSRRAIELVWQTSRALTFILAIATLVAGLLPAAAAWVGQLIVDGVVAAIEADTGIPERLLWLVALEGGIIAGIAGGQRAIQTVQSLLRAQLGQRVNVMILEKAQTLQLADFEDSEFYDKLTRARREASSRPLSLVNRTFGLIQNGLSLASFAGLLFAFSPWAVAILVLAGLPQFFSEAKFSGDAFRLFRWRSPDTRQQMYLETVLAREDSAKEVKLFQLGPLLLQRYRDIFERLYREDRRLTLRRDLWGFGLGLIATLAFYATYAWIVMSTVAGAITLGQMTMYLAVFRQGQSAVSASLTAISGMYEDNLYLSNLYEYLEQPVSTGTGEATTGAIPNDGLRFEGVSFRYPGSEQFALESIDLHLAPGQTLALVGANGSGKTTLIKLLAGLYTPSAGCIRLDGTDLRDWDSTTLRQRIGIIFQDFMRYQLPVGENIGAGDVTHFQDEARWQQAARQGLADTFIEEIPGGYHAQLGRWFKDGRELSGGQWQKIAVARAFMREEADVLVLDEPTAAMDAAAEAEIFAHFRELTRDRMAILISHRFSTVRMADEIAVIDGGRIIERGSHDSLLAREGQYAHLFQLQAAGYQ
ncbi:MAG: ABC transporter ATP-binding protein [Spiribacter salinus]|uniref:ABC transporter ATP-binding protein n=1 Tax=Spiribacter salinus TaxID=1335746 RepID=A0A540VWH5_9GAMM|nr:ABC transporter ATP-binding protein [Spiribacter sp.]MDR9454881.1 ABC transporter ATP-binding protein [Spiribacter sp.]TQF01047.1 MAG: ABC transporter ATP-binding protein [Spiribacter salinus]